MVADPAAPPKHAPVVRAGCARPAFGLGRFAIATGLGPHQPPTPHRLGSGIRSAAKTFHRPAPPCRARPIVGQHCAPTNRFAPRWIAPTNALRPGPRGWLANGRRPHGSNHSPGPTDPLPKKQVRSSCNWCRSPWPVCFRCATHPSWHSPWETSWLGPCPRRPGLGAPQQPWLASCGCPAPVAAANRPTPGLETAATRTGRRRAPHWPIAMGQWPLVRASPRRAWVGA